jgi:hypothetical protein
MALCSEWWVLIQHIRNVQTVWYTVWNQYTTPSACHLITYLLTYLLTPCSTVLLEKLSGLQLVKKFPAFYETRRFITAFTSARQMFLSWPSSIQSISTHHTSWRSIVILSSHLSLGLPNGLFPSGFPTKTLCTPLLSPYALHATHISFFSILLPAQ